jgi:hypothetical protein
MLAIMKRLGIPIASHNCVLVIIILAIIPQMKYTADLVGRGTKQFHVFGRGGRGMGTQPFADGQMWATRQMPTHFISGSRSLGC